MTTKLPTFRELADMRCKEASKGQRTINIKVSINTARMMVESEEGEREQLVAALRSNMVNFTIGARNSLSTEVRAIYSMEEKKCRALLAKLGSE